MTHTWSFHDGFETQDTSRGNGTVLGGAVELTDVRYSRAARRFALAAATGYAGYGTQVDTAGVWNAAAIQAPFVWCSFAFKLITGPGVAQFFYFMRFETAGVSRGVARIRNDLKIEIDAGDGVFATSANAIVTGQWYIVSAFGGQGLKNECIVRNADTADTVTSVQSTNARGGAAGTGQIFLGARVASTGDGIYDNYVQEAAGLLADIDDPISALTVKYACGLLVPNAVGSWDQWTGTFADVDDTPNDGDATVRTETAQNEAFTQALPATTSLVAQVGTVISVSAYAFVRALTAGINCQLRLRTSADTDGTNALIANDGVYHILNLLYTTDPATASTWTVSVIDGAEVGVERTQAAGNTMRATTVGLEILYTIGVIQRTRKTSYFIESYDPQKRIVDLQGHEVPYNEVRSNRWLRLLRKGLPTSQEEESYFDMEDMFFIEGLTYEQQWGQEPRLQLKGPDDFVADLIDKISKAGAGGL